MRPDEAKRAAAEAALALVADGMRLGLGTGSTAALFIAALGARVAAGLNIVGVPTSQATRRQAEGLRIPLAELDETELDLTVDGADEIDANLNLIKGGGGALSREKIVAASSKRMVVVAEASKQVAVLGCFALPVEVLTFGAASTARRIAQAAKAVGCDGELVLRRRGAEPYVTDNGNWIYDGQFGRIDEPERLARALSNVPGVVEHGLFIGLAALAMLGSPDGVRQLEAAGGKG